MTKPVRQLALGLVGGATATMVETAFAPGALFLPQFASATSADVDAQLLRGLQEVANAVPFRRMSTPGGRQMSVAITNCGALGWVSDANGYRYCAADPMSGLRWPTMPSSFVDVATTAAARAGYLNFVPDACLINRYEPGTQMTLHQDKNEGDFSAPIVSVSLGVSAGFLFGADERTSPTEKMVLSHGDVVVWGGPSRLRFHGVRPLAESEHPLTGNLRFNLTFRKAAR